MKKILVWGLLLFALIYVGVNWYLKQSDKNILNIEQTSVDTVFPDSESTVDSDSKTVKETALSQHTKEALLFDAPSTAKYLLSTSADLTQEKSMSIDTKEKIKGNITLGLNHPNGVRVLVVKGDKGQNIINEVPDGPFFDEYGDLNPGYTIQVTLIDLNNDGNENIVLALGKPNGRVDVSIFGIEGDASNLYEYLGTVESSSSTKFLYGKIVVCRADDTKIYKLQGNSIVEIH